MIRDIITIDKEKCNGCGLCVTGCHEGALQIINGKAELVNDLFCDGLGACIGECPQGAITIEKREAVPYDESIVMEKIIEGGHGVIKAHLKHLYEHGQEEFVKQGVEILKTKNIEVPDYISSDIPCTCHQGEDQITKKIKMQCPSENVTISTSSELVNWPIQLHLVNPHASWLDNADLLIAADCTAFSYANFHNKFMKGKPTIIFCPKLDKSAEPYIEKLSMIFKEKNIKSITILRMEVPCCGGTEIIVQRALELAQKFIFVKVFTISVNGELV